MAPSPSKIIPSSTRKRRAETEIMASGGGCSSQVRVFVRVRPLTAKEQGAGSTGVLDVSDGCVVQLSGRRFTYDAAFDAETTQAELYEKFAPTLLQSFLDGFNATVSSPFSILFNVFISHSDSSDRHSFTLLDNGVWPDRIWKDIHNG
jgi:hypothetical protein